jgi:ABC-2 type transport system ATP-binding protein
VSPVSPDSPLVSVDSLRVEFKDRRALDDVTLSIGRGQIVALLGPNGAGKSTLVRCISGQQRPDGGSVSLDGRDPFTDDEVRSRIGIVPQALAVFPSLTVEENLNAFAQMMDVPGGERAERVEQVLTRVHLAHRRTDIAEKLSGGMQRLLNLGAGLLHGPSIVLMDEPTVGIDRRARFRFRDLLAALRDEGLSIVLTTHELEEAELLAEELIVLADGKLLASGPANTLLGDAFGERRELRLSTQVPLDGEAVPPQLMGLVTRLGLEAGENDNAGVWRGLVRASDPACSELFELCSTMGPGVAEFRMRRPGLGRLLDHLHASGSKESA